MTAPRVCQAPDCSEILTGRQQKWCTHAHGVQTRDYERAGWTPTPRACANPSCGKEFMPFHRQNIYCSKEHQKKPGSWTPKERKCARRGCAVRFITRHATHRYHSRQCISAAHYARQGKPSRAPFRNTVCVVCGKTLTDAKRHFNAQTCPGACREENKRRSHAKSVASRTPEQRQRHRDQVQLHGIKTRMLALGNTAAFDPTVTLTEVIARFNGVCQARGCGRQCGDRMTTPKLWPNAPTIDHRLPLKAHGGHTRKNTQLLCRQCNLEKNDDVCRYCGGALDDHTENLCAKCIATGRTGRESFSVCAKGHVGYDGGTPGGWCIKCRKSGTVWVKQGLTRRAANALAATVRHPVDPYLTAWLADAA